MVAPAVVVLENTVNAAITAQNHRVGETNVPAAMASDAATVTWTAGRVVLAEVSRPGGRPTGARSGNGTGTRRAVSPRYRRAPARLPGGASSCLSAAGTFPWRNDRAAP